MQTCSHGDDDVRRKHESCVEEKEDYFAENFGDGEQGAFEVTEKKFKKF